MGVLILSKKKAHFTDEQEVIFSSVHFVLNGSKSVVDLKCEWLKKIFCWLSHYRWFDVYELIYMWWRLLRGGQPENG